MKAFQIRVIVMLSCALLVASCAKKPDKTSAIPAEADPKPEVGALQAVIEYGTGVTQVKAGQEAAKKLKAIDVSRKEQMEEVAE